MSTDALIALVGVATAAVTATGVVMAAWFRFRGELEQVRSSIGAPNGRGNVVDMLSELLKGQASQDHRLAKLEQSQNSQESRLAHVESMVLDGYDHEGRAS